MKSGEFTSVAAQVGCLRYSDRESADRRRFPLLTPLYSVPKGAAAPPPSPRGSARGGRLAAVRLASIVHGGQPRRVQTATEPGRVRG